MTQLRFSTGQIVGNRIHYLSEADVHVLLSRLPREVWSQLQAVHFNDRAWGNRFLGYVSETHGEIAICALPSRIGLTRFLDRGKLATAMRCRMPHEFGASPGHQWSQTAVRRFLLYYVFLYSLGRVQAAYEGKRRIASKRQALQFADQWWDLLMSQRFDHPDPIHNRPTQDEFARLAADPADLYLLQEQRFTHTVCASVRGNGFSPRPPLAPFSAWRDNRALPI